MNGQCLLGTSADGPFQMVQLLAQKLPDVFQVFFRRKGQFVGLFC
jgi:hypothetical protein